MKKAIYSHQRPVTESGLNYNSGSVISKFKSGSNWSVYKVGSTERIAGPYNNRPEAEIFAKAQAFKCQIIESPKDAFEGL